MTNPIKVEIQVIVAPQPQALMKLSLLPDGLGLRVRYRALVLHYSCLEYPLYWDLGKNISLDFKLPCVSAPPKLVITIYGLPKEGPKRLELIFRNWGSPDDGL